MPYHNAPLMLARHVYNCEGLPDYLREAVEVVVCDDASDTPIRPPGGFSTCRLQLFRIPPPHVRWSHRCATNVAAHNARGEWLLITDIDHVVPTVTWKQLAARYRSGELRADMVYNFRRHNTDGSEYKPHPDSWLIHRSMWRKIGGYDTRYRGHYGQNAAFQDRVAHHAGQVHTLYESLTRITRDDIADASMPVEFGRKDPKDRVIIGGLRAKFRSNGTYYAPGAIVYHERVYP